MYLTDTVGISNGLGISDIRLLYGELFGRAGSHPLTPKSYPIEKCYSQVDQIIGVP